jgi:hypothetical protein
MRTDAEIRLAGMKALIDVLGLVEAERFIAAVSRDRLDYTEWRRANLPLISLDTLAVQANTLAEHLDKKTDHA